VIKNPWNMDNLFRRYLLNKSGSKIIILRTFVTGTKTADCFHNVGTINTQMTKEIVSQKKFRIPVTLKIGVNTNAGLGYFIFVRINYPHIGVGENRFSDIKESMFRQQIVMVEQGDKFTCSQRECRIGGARDMTVLIATYHSNPGVLGCVAFE